MRNQDWVSRAADSNKTAEYLEAIKEGQKELFNLAQQPGGPEQIELLCKAREARPQEHRILQTCAWSALSKRIGDGAALLDGDGPALLGTFIIPFMVTFAPETMQGQKSLEIAPPLPVREFLHDALLRTEAFAKVARVVLADTLYRPADLIRQGPEQVTRALYSAVSRNERVCLPEPGPCVIEACGDSWLTLRFYAVGAACLPGLDFWPLKLPQSETWPDDSLCEFLTDEFAKRGLSVSRMEGFPPMPIADCTGACTGSAVMEVGENLRNALDLYGSLRVRVQFSLEGIAELSGEDRDGNEYVLAPPFIHPEPRPTFARCIESLCNIVGHEWDCAYVQAHRLSGQMFQ